MKATNQKRICELFVSGPPRGGTTLLQLILSSNPLVSISPESHFIQEVFSSRPDPHVELFGDQLDAVLNSMKNDVKLQSWPNLNLSCFLEKLGMERSTLADLLRRLFIEYARATNPDALYVGNKKGLYCTEMGMYFKKVVFPDSKFIFIVRDPRDVVRSIRKNLVAESIETVSESISKRYAGIQLLLEAFPDDVMVMKYEELVVSPEETCRTLCNFLNVPYDEGMLKFYEKNQDSSQLLGVTKQIHKNTMTPLNKNLIGQWKSSRDFSKADLRNIERINRQHMKKFGYEFSSGFLARLFDW